MLLDKRKIEDLIRNTFAVLGDRDDCSSEPLEGINVSGIRCVVKHSKRGIIIPVPLSVSYEIIKIGGIRIEICDINKIYGIPFDGKFLVIWCSRFKLREIFNRLMSDILVDISTDFDANDIIDRLKGWKMLLSSSDNRNEEKGLWGELYFLKFLLENNFGTIESWKGPLGATKDFQFTGKRVEIKTSSIRSGWFVSMHGFYQANNIPGVNDFLVFIRIEEDKNGLTISQMVMDIQKMLNPTDCLEFGELLSNFENNFFEESSKWNVLESKIFPIDSDFPGIGSNDFVRNTLPSGVIDFSYTSDLSGIASKELCDFNSL